MRLLEQRVIEVAQYPYTRTPRATRKCHIKVEKAQGSWGRCRNVNYHVGDSLALRTIIRERVCHCHRILRSNGSCDYFSSYSFHLDTVCRRCRLHRYNRLFQTFQSSRPGTLQFHKYIRWRELQMNDRLLCIETRFIRMKNNIHYLSASPICYVEVRLNIICDHDFIPIANSTDSGRCLFESLIYGLFHPNSGSPLRIVLLR